jgi:virginiamycin B lyase
MAGRRGTFGAVIGLLAALLVPATASAITEYPLQTPNSQPSGIAVGPDGALWFTEENMNRIGRITTAGQITDEFQIPTPFSTPSEIVAGPDGALWFTEFGAAPKAKIGRVTTGGVFTEFEIPTFGAGPDGITAGPDGALWFTENGAAKIGRITTDGAITEYPLPNGFRPGDIALGPDGRLWFTESEAHKIGAIDINTKNISEYDLPAGADPSGIAASSAALWFTQFGASKVGRISETGFVGSEYGTGAGPSGIAFGRDSALWFTETGAGKIGRMTTSGSLTEFNVPTSPSEPGGIVAGPDGAMWFTEFVGNRIGRIEVGLPSTFVPPPTPIPIGSQGQPAKKKCKVPKLRGLTVKKATRALKKARCKYRFRGKGRVASSTPKAGRTTTKRVRVKCKRKPPKR